MFRFTVRIKATVLVVEDLRGRAIYSVGLPSLAYWKVSNPAGAFVFDSCEVCVLSDRSLCDGLITRPEESYRVWCVSVWSWSLDKEEVLAHKRLCAIKGGGEGRGGGGGGEGGGGRGGGGGGENIQWSYPLILYSAHRLHINVSGLKVVTFPNVKRDKKGSVSDSICSEDSMCFLQT